MEKLDSGKERRELRFFKITNPNIIGEPFESLLGLHLEDAIFTRYIENGKNMLADKSIVLKENALLAAVGSVTELEKLALIIGPESDEHVELDNSALELRKIILSRPEAAGKTIAELFVEEKYHVKITRVIRGAVEISPLFVKQLLLGDKIVAIGRKEDIEKFTKVLGDDAEDVFKTQFAPISIGVSLGILAGFVPIPFLNTNLGMTGGILILAMFLGYKVKFMGTLWQIPQQTNAFLKQLGLFIFFAAMGVNAGKELVHIFEHPGSFLLIMSGVSLTFLPVMATYAVATFILKKNILEVLGVLAGTVNNSSVIAAVNEKYETEIATPAFAFSYPLGLILSIAASEILRFIFF